VKEDIIVKLFLLST